MRGVAERAGLWAFPDERALDMREVVDAIADHGEVLGARINWTIVLTQGVVVARRSRTPVLSENRTEHSGGSIVVPKEPVVSQLPAEALSPAGDFLTQLARSNSANRQHADAGESLAPVDTGRDGR